MGRKVVFVLGICGLFKINVLNWLKPVRWEFLSFVKTDRFCLCWSPSRKSASAVTEVTSISYRQSFRKYHSLVTIPTPRDRWYHWFFMQTRMAALNLYRLVTFYHSLSWQKDGKYVLLVQVELLCKGIWKILIKVLKTGNYFWKPLWMNTIS